MSDSPSDAANRARGVFLGDLAHDMSTPLTAIHGATELLLAGAYGPLDGEQRALVHEILASARELRAFVQDVADLGALDTGRLVFASTRFDVASLVDELRANLTETAARRAVSFTLDAQIDTRSIESDERRMRQILSVLFGYAIKASKRGSQVAGAVSQRDGILRVEARSTGVSPSGDPEMLFEDRRDRMPGVPKPYRGPGLGLPLVRRVVEAWGGRVDAHVADGALVLGVELPVTAPPAK
jgi:two-component system cell cycle sensor histidine kinase PleC